MSTLYLCKKCNYSTNHFNDLIRHMKKKYKCMKNIDAYRYSDDQLILLSLIPYTNNIHNINNDEIDYCKDSDLLYDNLSILLRLINEIDKLKLKKCMLCEEEKHKILDLRKHIIKCFYLKLLSNKDSNTSDINIVGNNSNNINSNNGNNTIVNGINIFFNMKPPIPFDEDWDISNISSHVKAGLLMNKLMYTNLLEEILKNESNLNVIIDKKNNSGIVYKNNIEKYIEMKSKDIVENTMEKLNKQLLQINDDVKDTCLKDCIDFTRRIITKKYIDYINDTNLQKNVSSCISDIYDKKRNDAIKISQSIENKRMYKENGF